MREPVITISPCGVACVGAAVAGACVTSGGGSVLCACAVEAVVMIATRATLARSDASILMDIPRFVPALPCRTPKPNRGYEVEEGTTVTPASQLASGDATKLQFPGRS